MLLSTIPTFEYLFSGQTPYSPDLYLGESASGDLITVKVYPDWYDNTLVEWSIPSEWGDCTFEVFKSPSPEGPFTDLTQAPTRNNTLTDQRIRTNSKFVTTFYVVKVNLPDGTTKSSHPETWGTTQNDWVSLRAKEIRRRELLLLRKFVGVESLVLKRKTFGKRCPNCWDTRTGLVTKPDCKVCYGTSFEGGYFKPIVCRIQYTPTVSNSNLTYAGKIESNRLTAWTIDYPPLDYQDLVYRLSDSRMFWTRGVDPTELQAATIRQNISLEELSKESIEYELAERSDVKQVLKSLR